MSTVVDDHQPLSPQNILHKENVKWPRQKLETMRSMYVYGRQRFNKQLVHTNKSSLSVGCADTHLANVNLDLNKRFSPDIVADARRLPFRPSVFEQVLFTDVIEHLPKGDERKALKEINRTLCEEGELILTTPNAKLLFTFLDPTFYVLGHRHYTKPHIRELVNDEGFSVIDLFTIGWLWQCVNKVIYCFVMYPLRMLLNCSAIYFPRLLQELEDNEYNFERKDGYTIVVRGKKKGNENVK
jgi:SAM-dependent methyltransferase